MAPIFRSPKIPRAPEPVKTPTIDTARLAVEQEEKINKNRGRASTILTGDQSRTQIGGLKTVLGA